MTPSTPASASPSGFDAGASVERIPPGDARYAAVVEKRFNKRFTARPDYVCLARSTGDVVAVVEAAVREGRRLVVTSGGHCLEGFVSDPAARVILDVSPMTRIAHDRERRAIVVEAGATVGETFRALHERWDVVVPLGEHPAIGIGGHIAGGAFGFLCRQLGLAADYLHAVEVVTVGADGRARVVVATRDADDPHRELWWAHTGGGAGNFGVVTRCWFRAADALGADPRRLLPPAPASIDTFVAAWRWDALDRDAFARLLRNHGAWCAAHASSASANVSLFTLLEVHRAQFGTVVARGVSTAGPAAARQWDEHLASLGDGLAPPERGAQARLSWPAFATDPFPDLFATPPGGVSVKVKDALLRRPLSERQIEIAHGWLTRTDHDAPGGMLGLATYGGAVNRVARDATAAAQRDGIIDMACNVGWIDPADEARNLAWVRGFYRELFADTGGVPVPGAAYEGTLINHPDTDLADPTLNQSGVAWSALYYQDNYPRLQRVKARYDPRDVFHHALGVRPG